MLEGSASGGSIPSAVNGYLLIITEELDVSTYTSSFVGGVGTLPP